MTLLSSPPCRCAVSHFRGMVLAGGVTGSFIQHQQ
jgi:hypothetical protein